MLVRDLVNRPPNEDAALDVEVFVQKVAQQQKLLILLHTWCLPCKPKRRSSRLKIPALTFFNFSETDASVSFAGGVVGVTSTISVDPLE
jgi:hypothetical protein